MRIVEGCDVPGRITIGLFGYVLPYSESLAGKAVTFRAICCRSLSVIRQTNAFKLFQQSGLGAAICYAFSPRVVSMILAILVRVIMEVSGNCECR